MLKTPEGVLRKNRIMIKKANLPVSKEPANPPVPTIDRSRPSQTTDVASITSKPSSLQSIFQPRVADKLLAFSIHYQQ